MSSGSELVIVARPATIYSNSSTRRPREGRVERGSSQRQQLHRPQMTPIIHHQPYDLRR